MRFNGLSDAQEERLDLLTEELGESLQALGKVKRHGYPSGWPVGHHWQNKGDLERELGHVLFAISQLIATGDIDFQKVKDACAEKYRSIGPYLHAFSPFYPAPFV